MILKPLQYLYEFGSSFKNKLYDKDYLKKIKIDCPVLSVGNLSVGGTGKTPCVYLLVEELSKNDRFKNIVIVSRSYKASLKYPEKVNLINPEAAQRYGDEPCLLQTLLPFSSVWCGPSKSQTALKAFQVDKPDLIIVDDGFSHRKLQRNFDLVLMDATAPLNYLQPLPVGRLREPLSELKRADAILLTRVNLVELNKIEKIKEVILKANPELKNDIFNSASLTTVEDCDASINKLFVFCGLGHPKSFKTSLEKMNFQIKTFKEFPDHYMYTVSDLDRILEEYLSAQQIDSDLKLITTEKDLIKIKNHKIKDYIHTAKNKIEIIENKKGDFFEKIGRSI